MGLKYKIRYRQVIVYKYAVTSVLNSESLDLYLGMIYEKETCSSPSQ